MQDNMQDQYKLILLNLIIVVKRYRSAPAEPSPRQSPEPSPEPPAEPSEPELPIRRVIYRNLSDMDKNLRDALRVSIFYIYEHLKYSMYLEKKGKILSFAYLSLSARRILEYKEDAGK